MVTAEQEIDNLKQLITNEFEEKTGLTGVFTEMHSGGMGLPTLIFRVANPTKRHYLAIKGIKDKFEEELNDVMRVTVLKNKGGNYDSNAEKGLFVRTLSESLIVNRYSFQDDFFSRYINTATGAEEQIVAAANHIVYGRRGSGKSTLLLYALHTLEQSGRLSAWVDLQMYSKRNDDGVIADVLCEILEQFGKKLAGKHLDLVKSLKAPGISFDTIRRLLPSIKNCLIPDLNGSYLYLDDFHIIERRIQPKLLNMLYGITRGSRIFIKISSIETLTTTYDTESREGMQLGHDLQKISLDYNLTTPDKTYEHIKSILNSIAQYCGLHSIQKLCRSNDVLKRLVWATAGVPRDALSIFSQAMSRSQNKMVAVSAIISASLNLLNTKMQELENDTNELSNRLNDLLEQIKQFCFDAETNAFLVKKNQSLQDILRLADLRLLHIIHEGFTPHKAGEQYIALILDYSFYVSERISSKIKPHNANLEKTETKKLRNLPTFSVNGHDVS